MKTKLSANLRQKLTPRAFPLSAKYDPEWVIDNVMGPQPLWLAESLTQKMHLKPGMKVLDLGCGKALTSIFLAKEYGVQVWAVDLWIKPDENLQRIKEAGLENQVFPVHAEAHSLPFAEGFFDAMVSFDAYHYFGTDDLYLGYYQKFARPGAEIGHISPGVTKEINKVPTALHPYWDRDFFSFHSPQWWKWHWQKTDLVDVTVADMVPNGHQLWLTWSKAFLEMKLGPQDIIFNEAKMLEVDKGQQLGFTRLLATKK